ncbi:MAG: YSC84-related protein [Acidobacteriota bacterium]
MKRGLSVLIAVVLVASFQPAYAGKSGAAKPSASERKRQKIDTMAAETMKKLMERNESARELRDQAYGYAVFDNFKLSLLFTGGGGAGVAVRRGSGQRIYMRMGTAGLNLGLGGQKYQVVFLFQNQRTFDDFVEFGWKAETGANAVAGTAGANAEAAFTDGMAMYQLTQGGLMLQADISGTKYWKAKKLNRKGRRRD